MIGLHRFSWAMLIFNALILFAAAAIHSPSFVIQQLGFVTFWCWLLHLQRKS